MANSADPDQLASSEANWSGSTRFARTGYAVLSKRRIKSVLKTQMSYWLKAFGDFTKLILKNVFIVMCPVLFDEMETV